MLKHSHFNLKKLKIFLNYIIVYFKHFDFITVNSIFFKNRFISF